jgi:hypothetical protein
MLALLGPVRRFFIIYIAVDQSLLADDQLETFFLLVARLVHPRGSDTPEESLSSTVDFRKEPDG